MAFSLRKKWRSLFLCSLVGLLLGMGQYTVYYAKGTSYLSNDSKACANCHVMREHYDSWQHSSHHAVASCNDCHLPQKGFSKWLCKAENGYRHSKGFTFQDFHEPIQIRPNNAVVLQQNCVRCHADLVSDICGQNGAEAQAVNCVRCHADVGHGPRR